MSMSNKKIALFTILTLLSVIAGSVFGLLDIFGFLDGRHGLSFTLLLSSISLIYFAIITVFTLGFADDGRVSAIFIISSLLFGITFFMMNLDPILSVFATATYFSFLMYAFSSSRKKAHNQIRFEPGDIFLPILRNGIFYLLILIAAITFAQSKQRIVHHNLIQPALIKAISKPSIFILNNQLNNQVQGQLRVLPKNIQNSPGGTQKIVRVMLDTSLQSMAENGQQDIYGFKPKEIPIHLTTIDNQGNIDITPTIEAMLPQIAQKLNVFIEKYAFITPFVVALFVFLILQPFMLPVNLLEAALTLVIFKILLSSNFIKIEEEQRPVEKLHL